jgi:crotonobetainyl-CoA:carnitine CoA-transferase CaiB-like acyl-CoA transferase
MAGILDGIRVLEVASWTYVPMAGGVLAEWGADVIKVEHPESGDPQRGLISGGLFPGGATTNFTFEHPNRGKRSVGIDLGSEDGRQVLLKLAATADVFLTNFLPSARAKLRIDVEDIRAVNPNVVYVRGTGLGDRGPERNQGGYDNCTFWARGGSADIATPDEVDYPINQPGGAYGDSLGGLVIAGGISAALLHRERTGQAKVVDCSLLAMGTWATSFTIAGAAAFGLERFPMGGGRAASPNPLVNTYRTSDNRFLSLVILQADRFWPELVQVIGRPNLEKDPRFVDSKARNENKDACVAALDEAFAARTLEEWKEVLKAVKFVWAPVQTSGDIMRDPQVVANGYIRDVVGSDGNTFKLVAAPLQFDESPPDIIRAPQHGEHTDEVLQELGLDMDEIVDLKVKGALL